MRSLTGMLIVVAGVSTVSLSIGVILWSLDSAGLIDLGSLRAYPSYLL